MKVRSSMRWYLITFAVAVIVVFFLSITSTATGGKKYEFNSSGWQSFRKGMDVAGGVRLNYKIDLSKYKEAYPNHAEYVAVTRNVKDIILKNIDNRISKLGVSDYESRLQTIGTDEFVVIEIGGVFDLDQAKAIIGKTVELEFKTAFTGGVEQLRPERQLMAENFLKEAVAGSSGLQEQIATRQSDGVYYGTYMHKTLKELPEIYSTHKEVLAGPTLGKFYPRLLEGVHSVIPPVSGYSTTETRVEGRVITKVTQAGMNSGTTTLSGTTAPEMTYNVEEIVVTYAPARVSAKDPKTQEILNGAYFKFAAVSQSQTGQPVATITFDDKGKEIFCNLTETIVGQPLAIFVGGKMVTSPTIREKICGGSAQIDGQFTPADANKLVRDLNEGALPAALILSNEEKVSAKLGDSALQGVLYTAAAGLILVFLYMSFMYGLRQGISAVVTLLFFLMLLLAVVKLIGYALSLSGLAAILLSIGMGVDGNILIYERIKEEEQAGAKGESVIQHAYTRSRTAIRDGNLTTLMIGVLLLFVGTNIFKGFGTMMIVSILFTLFATVPFVKQILLFLHDNKTTPSKNIG